MNGKTTYSFKMKKPNLNYQLGIYVGEHIVSQYLPTLSTDGLKSRNVIELSVEDTTKCNILNKALTDSYRWNGGTGDRDGTGPILHKTWLAHQNKMADKYLPQILECLVPKVHPTKMSEFKLGIIESLWDCDLCWYSINADDIEFVQTDKYAWCTKIYLKLDVNN